MWRLGALFLVWIVMRGRYAAYADLVRAKPVPEGSGDQLKNDTGDEPAHANDNGGADAPSDPKSDTTPAPGGQSMWDWIFRPKQVTPENAGP